MAFVKVASNLLQVKLPETHIHTHTHTHTHTFTHTHTHTHTHTLTHTHTHTHTQEPPPAHYIPLNQSKADGKSVWRAFGQ